jgi:hypothetical protein
VAEERALFLEELGKGGRIAAVEKLEVERDYMEKQTVAVAHSKALITLKDELPEEFDKKIICPP